MPRQVSDRVVLKKIKNIESISYFINAMKLITPAKLHKDLRRLERAEGFGYKSIEMMLKSDTYLQRKWSIDYGQPKELLVLITTDSGLCGPVNSQTVVELRNYLK